MSTPAQSQCQSLPVYAGEDLHVVAGANVGDTLSFAAELDFDDTYELAPEAALLPLTLAITRDGTLAVADSSPIGTAGHALHLDSLLTLMPATGETVELIVLVEVDEAGDVAAIYALPLSPLTPKEGYTLVGIDEAGARRKFAETGVVSFTRGTRITLASGAQKPIEELQVGDLVLTRDSGPQAIRWIGASTARATGAFAPIRIRAGALHNDNDLIVSPDHRLFIYQRSDRIGAGRSEILVRARHLVNGDTVVQEEGGFVDYFQLVFDEHQIIYAEGIAAETLLLDEQTRPALPPELDEKLSQILPGHDPRTRLDFDLADHLANHPDLADLLKRASTT